MESQGLRTKILQLADGEENPSDLIPFIYGELKRMAKGRVAMERQGLTMGATDLVHEAWMRLERSQPEKWRDKAQFFAAASEAMRRILVEAARRRLAAKRGANAEKVPLEEVEIISHEPDERLLAVHEVLDRLAKQDPDKAEIVRLRYFCGMDNEEIASVLGINEKTVRRHWTLAKVWLYRALGRAVE